jgi:multidrug resistance efflux pump
MPTARHLLALLLLASLRGWASDPAKEAAKLVDELPNLEEKAEVKKPVVAPVAAAESRLEYARRKRDRWAQLAKHGVVSRAELDTAVMDYYLAALGCERARLADAQRRLSLAQEGLPERLGEPVSEGDASTGVAEAQKRVQAAENEYKRVQLELTRTNLERFRKLYAEHLVRKDQVQRLENIVAELERTAPPAATPSPATPTPPAAASQFSAPAQPSAPAPPAPSPLPSTHAPLKVGNARSTK